MTEILGLPITRPIKVGIVVADFNDLVTTRLLASAQQALRQAGIPEENILVVQVPGAMELPRVTRRLSETGVIDGVIALGAVVQGETDHYTYVCQQSAAGLAQASLTGPIPVMFGVLMTANMDQALNRAGGKGGNKGRECAQALLQVLSVEQQLSELR